MDLIFHQDTRKSTENNGTHCLHFELNPLQTQVNRQWINIILKELTKSNEDIRALFNITNQLAT